MTYYRIVKYLKSKGLTQGEADYVRGMIRQMRQQVVKAAKRKPKLRCTGEGYCPLHRVVHYEY